MAELCGAIELAHNRNLTNLWLESSSSLVVQASVLFFCFLFMVASNSPLILSRYIDA
jgi:hypothetical protein